MASVRKSLLSALFGIAIKERGELSDTLARLDINDKQPQAVATGLTLCLCRQWPGAGRQATHEQLESTLHTRCIEQVVIAEESQRVNHRG
jgi:hypothetical protein